MLPLMLKEPIEHDHPKGWPHAHLLDVHITDGQDHGHTTMLIWALPSAEVLRHIHSQTADSIPLESPRVSEKNLDVLAYYRDNDVPLQYYIGKKPRVFNKRIASFRGVGIYDVSKTDRVKH